MEQVDGKLLSPSDNDGNSLSGSINSASQHFRSSRRRGRVPPQQQQQTGQGFADAERKQNEWQASLAAMQRENKARMVDAVEPPVEEAHRGSSPSRPLRRRRGGRSPLPLREAPQPSPPSAQLRASTGEHVTETSDAAPSHDDAVTTADVNSHQAPGHVTELVEAMPPPALPVLAPFESRPSPSTSPDAPEPQRTSEEVASPDSRPDEAPHHSHADHSRDTTPTRTAASTTTTPAAAPADQHDAVAPAVDYDASLIDPSPSSGTATTRHSGEREHESAAGLDSLTSDSLAPDAAPTQSIPSPHPPDNHELLRAPTPEKPAQRASQDGHQDPSKGVADVADVACTLPDFSPREPLPPTRGSASAARASPPRTPPRVPPTEAAAAVPTSLASPPPRPAPVPVKSPEKGLAEALKPTGRTPRSFTANAPPALSSSSASPSPSAPLFLVQEVPESVPGPVPEPMPEPPVEVPTTVPEQTMQVVARREDRHTALPPPPPPAALPAASASPPREGSRSPQPVRPLSLPQPSAHEAPRPAAPTTLRPRTQAPRTAPAAGGAGATATRLHRPSATTTTTTSATSRTTAPKRAAVYSPLPKRRAVMSSAPHAETGAASPTAGTVTSRGASHSVRTEDSQFANAPLTGREQPSTVLKGTETYERRRQAALKARKTREERQAAEEALQMVHTARGRGTATTARVRPQRAAEPEVRVVGDATPLVVGGYAEAMRRPSSKSVGYQRKPTAPRRNSPARRPSLSATPAAAAATVTRGSPSAKRMRPAADAHARERRTTSPELVVTWAHADSPKPRSAAATAPAVVVAAPRKADAVVRGPGPLAKGSTPVLPARPALMAPVPEEASVHEATEEEDEEAEAPSATAASRVPVFCTSCGEKYLAHDARFCAFCGHRRENL